LFFYRRDAESAEHYLFFCFPLRGRKAKRIKPGGG
jgi:hypothetical protein